MPHKETQNQAWSHRPAIAATTQEAEAGRCQVQGLPGPQSEVKDSLVNLVRPYLKDSGGCSQVVERMLQCPSSTVPLDGQLWPWVIALFCSLSTSHLGAQVKACSAPNIHIPHGWGINTSHQSTHYRRWVPGGRRRDVPLTHTKSNALPDEMDINGMGR